MPTLPWGVTPATDPSFLQSPFSRMDHVAHFGQKLAWQRRTGDPDKTDSHRLSVKKLLLRIQIWQLKHAVLEVHQKIAFIFRKLSNSHRLSYPTASIECFPSAHQKAAGNPTPAESLAAILPEKKDLSLLYLPKPMWLSCVGQWWPGTYREGDSEKWSPSWFCKMQRKTKKGGGNNAKLAIDYPA